MKKIWAFLVIGILVISGFGVFATSIETFEKINTEPKPLSIEVVARGGLGLTLIYKNKMYDAVDLKHNIIVIKILCPIVNIDDWVSGVHEIIPARGRVKVRTFGDIFIFGFGGFFRLFFIQI